MQSRVIEKIHNPDDKMLETTNAHEYLNVINELNHDQSLFDIHIGIYLSAPLNELTDVHKEMHKMQIEVVHEDYTKTTPNLQILTKGLLTLLGVNEQ